MSNEQRMEAAKQYVDKQLDAMKKFDAAPQLSKEEYESLIDEVASTHLPEATGGTMNDTERAALERKISEMRDEWESVEMTGGTNGAFDDVKTPRPWTRDERASAVLLDEMSEYNSAITFSFWSESSVHVVKHGNRVSCFVNVCRDNKIVEFRADAQDRKVAIALAWVAMKEGR